MKQCLLWLCFFACNTVFAQDNSIEKLNKQIATSKNTKDLIDIKNKISYELRETNIAVALTTAQENLALAQKEKYEFGEGTANICIANAYFKKGFYILGKEYSNRGLIIAEKLDSDSLRAAANLVLSSLYGNLGNFDLSIEKSLLAIKYFQKINDKEGIAKARVGMAQTYQIKNDLPAAEKILKELSEENIENKKTTVNILHTLANIYGMQEKYKEALVLDEKALIICEKNNLLFLKSSVYDNMANCFMFSGNYAKAKTYFDRCLYIDSSFGNKKQMADTYLNLGQLYQMQADDKASIKNLKRAIVLAQQSGYRQGAYQAYLLLSKAYAKNNQPDSALIAVNMGYTIKDSIINEKSESKIAELETLYQTEKREQELSLQKSKVSKKNWLLLASCIMILLLGFSSVLFVRKRMLQNKVLVQSEVLKQQDIATKAIIEAEENERRRIAAELHDGVGQMMSVAKMNLSVFENDLLFTNEAQRKNFENVIALLDDSCKEVRNVSHQMMPNALLKTGLASAVREFISKIDNHIIKVSLHTEGLNERLDSNIETVLYRVIQECVNNVLKHAKADHLDISIINDEQGIAATIEDNGIGFDATKKENMEGIGLKNIVSRISYLKGTIDFSSGINKGTIIAIHIPL